MEKDFMILKPLAKPRKGWDKAFQQMHNNNDDQLLMVEVFDEEAFDEWDQ